jgi:hypothetical protein
MQIRVTNNNIIDIVMNLKQFKIKIIYTSVILLIGLLTINSCQKEDDCTELTWYQDADSDGFGNPNNSQQSCSQPTGFVADNTDFDDTNNLLNPNAIEIADNSIDENGDGFYAYNLYVDSDSDGYGITPELVDVPNIINVDSDVPAGYTLYPGDCDDTDAQINPNANEIPGNNIDDNCNGETDE